MTTVAIKLTQGKVAVISPEDADLALLKWFARLDPRKQSFNYYVGRSVRRAPLPQLSVRLHRVVASRMAGRILGTSEHIDHINGDGLDNRRENLRIATRAQNQANQGKQRNNTSGFKGVSWFGPGEKWRATININGRWKSIGYFRDVHQAAIAYDRVAYEMHGEFANCNYPRFACGLQEDL